MASFASADKRLRPLSDATDQPGRGTYNDPGRFSLLKKFTGSIMPAMLAQVITGVVPPLLGEARIREAWPSVQSKPAIASLGRALSRTIILAPLGWLLMSTVYFGKVLLVIGRR